MAGGSWQHPYLDVPLPRSRGHSGVQDEQVGYRVWMLCSMCEARLDLAITEEEQ